MTLYMNRISTLCLFVCLAVFAQAQNGVDFYRSTQNQYYWKNRKPHAAYWQQDVHYAIKAAVDDKTGIIDGNETLTYFNNSPDTLHFVYFHLYQNAFVKGSYLESLNRANRYYQRFGPYEAAGKGTEIETVTSSNHWGSKNEAIEFIDNSIMKVKLTTPLLPGQSATFSIKFKTYFDSGDQRRRMKKFRSGGSNYTHFDGVHWYPRMCVYDAKFGWETAQHLSKEFYGDYGAYDVELTFPNHYVVEATGVLQNRSEVLPDELRKKLDIANFKDKPVGSPASEITAPNGTTKTWKYHADNVHDFAWTADPTYRLAETEWNGVKCVAIAQETNAAGWQDIAEFTSKVIQVYSRDFGMYAYPKMVVADAQDGMEYPMLTLNGGNSPGNHFVIAHEVGHNWFFGMVGNNETYRAALDEGFTQFLTAWSLKAIDGVPNPDDRTNPTAPVFAKSAMYYKSFKKKYNKRFDIDLPIDENTVYNGYLTDAINKNDAQLNTHSDDFSSALGHGGGYRHVYYKTATMLYNLQYVLGDSLFTAAMKNYFNQWKICHPYFDDFRSSIIQYTHIDLNWFFDQWMETTKRIDYSVGKIKKVKVDPEKNPDALMGSIVNNGSDPSRQAYEITFKRKEEMQMPIDFVVINEKNDTFSYTIPNTYFSKKDKNTTTLKYWLGWGMLNKKYTATVFVPGKIKNVVIDPSHRLADVNMLNNSKKLPLLVRFDSKVIEPVDRKHYILHWRPDLWYNNVDGIKAGIHLNGHYMNHLHRFSTTVWYNTAVGKSEFYKTKELVNYRAYYSTAIDRNLHVFGETKFLDGLIGNLAGLHKMSGNNRFSIYFKGMYRNNHTWAWEYLQPRAQFNPDMRNNTLNLEAEHRYNYKRGNGKILLQLRSSALYNDYDYQWAKLEVINNNYLGKLEIRTRTIGQYITGNNIAPESQLYQDGANGEEMMDSKFWRSNILDQTKASSFALNGNIVGYGGGLNLRGFNLMSVPEVQSNGIAYSSYSGKGGAAANVEVEFDRLVRFAPRLLRNTFKFDCYGFADAGYIKYTTFAAATNPLSYGYRWSNLRADAGLGAALTIKKWGRLATCEPITIRCDVPMWRNTTGAGSPIGTKYVIAIGRAF